MEIAGGEWEFSRSMHTSHCGLPNERITLSPLSVRHCATPPLSGIGSINHSRRAIPSMAGNKRNKVKQKAHQIAEAISPSHSPPVADDADDDGLIDDLLAQIENNPSTTAEAAKVINEVEIREAAATPPKKKKDPFIQRKPKRP